MDDDALLLHELRRSESERKLRAIPNEILQTAWVREAQVEAVIDAVLAVRYAGDVGGYASARHVGEWCARITADLGSNQDPNESRRIGVLSGMQPSVIRQIPELAHLALSVRDYQAFRSGETDSATPVALVVHVAVEFDRRLRGCGDGNASAGNAVRSMLGDATDASVPIVASLARIARPQNLARVRSPASIGIAR